MTDVEVTQAPTSSVNLNIPVTSPKNRDDDKPMSSVAIHHVVFFRILRYGIRTTPHCCPHGSGSENQQKNAPSIRIRRYVTLHSLLK